MIPVVVDYPQPSLFESDTRVDRLGFSANQRRPVRFYGRLRENAFLLRVALRTLGRVVWSDDTWLASQEILDPVVTVHPDVLFLEAFSGDQSVYGLLLLDRGLFETEGEVRCGTTNVDFTRWLYEALDDMRSSRETWLRVEPAGVEVRTQDAGRRFERKVELPLSWVRGFVNLHAAMAMRGTRLRVRPVDLLAVLRHLQHSKAGSHRGRSATSSFPGSRRGPSSSRGTWPSR